MKVSFLEIAQIELDEAVEYYNYELPGLGDAFLTEVLSALDRIGEFPEAWNHAQNERGDVRPGGFPMELFTKYGSRKS